MNLANAIRVGSTMTKPTTWALVERREGDLHTCALGAAGVAEGFDPRHLMTDDLIAHWPELDNQAVCPVCKAEAYLHSIIANHLNDTHNWSREHIADWVDAQTLDLTPVGAPVAVEAT